MLGLVGDRGRHVEAVRVVDPAARVGDGDDPHALVGEEPGEVGADVAEALDRDPRVVQPSALLLERGADAVERAAGGRAVTADGAADARAACR